MTKIIFDEKVTFDVPWEKWLNFGQTSIDKSAKRKLDKELTSYLRYLEPDDDAVSACKDIGECLIDASVEIIDELQNIVETQENIESLLSNTLSDILNRFSAVFASDEEVILWCEGNLVGEWKAYPMGEAQFAILMYDETDRMHFKLRWSE